MDTLETLVQSVTLALDESGAKGYADKRESAVGEFGVMAGFIVPSADVKQVEQEIKVIASRFEASGKLHVAALSPGNQHDLRNKLYSYLLSIKCKWVYEAIYVGGFHAHQQMVSSLTAIANARRRSQIKPSGNNRAAAASLHQYLFQGTFAKGVQFCLEEFGEQATINVVTDHVDEAIAKLFHQAAQRLLNGTQTESNLSGYDPGDKTIHRGAVSATIDSTKSSSLKLDFKGIKYSITQSVSPLTLAADVLANSTHHHLKIFQGHLEKSIIHLIPA